MSERTPFTVISNDDPPEPEPKPLSLQQQAIRSALANALARCLETNPVTIVLMWEYVDKDGPELMSISIPPSNALVRGIVKTIASQIDDE